MLDYERIDAIKKFYGLNPSELAREIGLSSPQSLYDIAKGRNRISKDLAARIHTRYPELNVSWLITGEGDMFNGEPPVLASNTVIERPEGHATNYDRLEILKKMSGLSYRGLAMELGLKNAQVFYDIQSERYGISRKLADAVVAKYPNISYKWFLTGDGNMLVDSSKELEQNSNENTSITLDSTNIPQASESSLNRQGIPIVSVEAIAGFGTEGFCSDPMYITGYCDPSMFINEKVDFIAPVHGDSMLPKFHSGDRVACRIIKDRQFIQWGRPHLLATSQGVLLKKLREIEGDESKVLCVSENSEYEPFKVPWSDVQALAIIVGTIHAI